MLRMKVGNLYHVYKQSQKKNDLISEDDFKQKLLKLKPGEMLSVVVIKDGVKMAEKKTSIRYEFPEVYVQLAERTVLYSDEPVNTPRKAAK